ncbi:toll-like receptor 4 isoform X2 [Babylonia areolata]
MTNTARSENLTIGVVVIFLLGCDVSRAMPCTTTMSTAGPRVQCSHHRLTRFPAPLPTGVVWLDMASNFLTSLDDLKHPQFAALQNFDISYNRLSRLSKDTFMNLPTLETLNLSHNALGTLPSDVFSGLTNLTTLVLSATGLHSVSDVAFRNLTCLRSLDLSNNNLSSVPSAALRHLTYLQRLDLGSNRLTAIHNHSLTTLSSLQYLSLHSNSLNTLQPAAFDGLNNLIALDLQLNDLSSESGYLSEVFRPLVSLETLHLEYNSRFDLGYPVKLFDPLRSLKTLSLDIFSDLNFGTIFSNLTALENLALSADRLWHITNTTFSTFHYSALQTLNLQGCHPFRVDLCAFCHLPNLTHLIVVDTVYLKIHFLLLALYGVQNQTLEDVNFSHVHAAPTILDNTITKYMNNVCIKRLSLQDCDLVGISSTAFSMHGIFLKCLTHLDVSKNMIAYGENSMFMKLIIGMVSIEAFDFSGQRIYARGSNFHYRQQSHSLSPSWNETIYVNSASSLRYVNASGGIYDLAQIPVHIRVPNGSNLTVVDLSYCGAQNCDFTIIGLTNIHTFDFNGNDCNTVGNRVFEHMSTLRRLRLSSLYIQETSLWINGTALLQPLGDLEELELSSNRLGKLPPDLLKHQTHLKRLILDQNRFESIPVDISLLTDLEDLDLRDNLIHILSRTDTQTLDRLAANHTLTLRLRGNPLSCTCQALDMVRWLGTTTVRLDGEVNDGFDDDYDDNGRDFPCTLEDGSMSSTRRVLAEWEGHWRRCVGLPAFTVSAVAQLLQLLALLVTYLLWSNWTLVRHVWRVLRHTRLPRRADFAHDALLVYAPRDLGLALAMRRCMREVRPELRLALPDEEIVPGDIYAEALAECFERSWKIILLVTQEFLQHEMSGFMVLQAQASLSDALPHRVLLLYCGNLRAPEDGGGGGVAGDDARPAYVSMRRLLRMVPESHVRHVPGGIHAITRRLDGRIHPTWLFLVQAVTED